MRNGERLDQHALWQRAVEVVEKSGKSQKWIAANVKSADGQTGVSEGTVSKALSPNGVGRYAKIHAAIIALLTSYEVEGPIYRTVRKG